MVGTGKGERQLAFSCARSDVRWQKKLPFFPPKYYLRLAPSDPRCAQRIVADPRNPVGKAGSQVRI